MKVLKSSYGGRILATVGLTSVLVVAAAVPASAATSNASATAATLTLAGNTVITTGPYTASNDGTTQTHTGTTGPALNVLGFENELTAGVLAQKAEAHKNGSSVACAGAVGAGGLIQVGSTDPCTADPGATGGVVLGGASGITANAIYAWCTESAQGVFAGGATLVDATLGGNAIPLNPPPNTGAGSPLVLNEQTHNADGSFTVTAVDLALPPGSTSGLRLTLGSVTCGPSSVTAPTPAFPVKGLPIAAGVAGLGLGAVYLRRRHMTSRA